MGMRFNAPDFIQNSDAETIQARMMENLPENIDNMPGGFPYDFTMPTAIEKAELIQFHLLNTIKLMFPMWSYGEWLDYHAKEAGIQRKEAGYARGRLTVEGIEGTIIPEGSLFATEATDKPSIQYQTIHEYEIERSGTVEMEIIALEGGSQGNVTKNTITLMVKPIKGITKVFNNNPVTGGTEEESDEVLRERVTEVNVAMSASFVGNNSDYIRWAKEVTGVGSVAVIPEWDGPGTVKLVIVDANGQPADDYILQDVTDYIMSPEEPLERKAPIGASLTVVAPEVVRITYYCQVRLKPNVELEYVREQFRNQLLEYYEVAKQEGVLRFTKVAAVLSSISGVLDFTNLEINKTDHANISIGQDEYPETYDIFMELL